MSKQNTENRRLILRTLVLFFPVAIHFVLCSLTATYLIIGSGRLDQGVLILLSGYLALGLLCFLAPQIQMKYFLFCYSLLAILAITEVGLCFLISRPNDRVPWPPMHRMSIAADTMPGIEGSIVFSVNSLGIRGPDELSFNKAKTRILCLGGSTTECLYVSDRQSWPWRLQDLLTQRLGEKVFVGNGGLSGHFTLHHVHQIRNYKLVSQFDRILVLCGVNDMSRFLYGSYSRSKLRVPDEALTPEYDSLVYYRRLRLAQIARAFHQQYVAPIGIQQDVDGKWYAEARRKRQDAIQDGRIVNLPEGLTEAIAQYYRDLTDVVLACRERGVEPVFMTQPTMWAKELSPKLDALLWISTIETGTLAYVMETYNKEMRDVCREEGVQCIDLAAMLPKDTTVFYDDCHFNVSGCEKVASILADFFVDELSQEPHTPEEGSVSRVSIGPRFSRSDL